MQYNINTIYLRIFSCFVDFEDWVTAKFAKKWRLSRNYC